MNTAAAFDQWLTDHDVDVITPRHEGRYVQLDAKTVLDQFMVDGHPDRDRFQAVIGPYLDAAPSAVFAYGEMVAALWEQGNVMAALELKMLWNELAKGRAFTLYCAYRAASFANCDDLDAASVVCSTHSSVIPPKSYTWTELPAFVPAEEAQMFLPVPDAIIGVRRFVAGTLAFGYPHKLVADALLVASELATNAVRHGGGPFRTVIIPGEGHVRLEFHDTSRPRRGCASRSGAKWTGGGL